MSDLATYATQALALLAGAHIVIRPDEEAALEVTDLGLGDFPRLGLAIITYVNTERCCAKELVLLPGQTCPEHRHPAIDGLPGKEETFRCRMGRVYLYVEGEPTSCPAVRPPAARAAHFTVWHEVILDPGEQYTLAPDTKHWFQAGPEGAVVSEFSTRSRDAYDVFTDPAVRRTQS